MLCTDIQIPADAPEKGFVKAWNLIVSHSTRYAASFERIAKESENLHIKYMATEMSHLINTGRKLTEFDYKLSLKILDHIEVTPDGKLAVIFLTGMKITVL